MQSFCVNEMNNVRIAQNKMITIVCIFCEGNCHERGDYFTKLLGNLCGMA